MNKPTIHSSPEEVHAYNAQETNAGVQNLRQSVENLHETAKGHATSEDVKDTANRIDNLAEVTAANHPGEMVEKLDGVKEEGVSANEKLSNLEKNVSATNDLLQQLTIAVKQKSLPVELVGMEQIVIQGEQGIQGEKGDAGIQGPKGDKGDVGPQGPIGLQGEKGQDAKFMGPKGEHGLSGIPGRDGKDGLNGKDGKNGKDGTPDTPRQIATKLASLQGKDKLSYFALKDLPELFDPSHNLGGDKGGGGQDIRFNDSTGAQISAYVTALQFGTGVTPSYANGVITITASGGGGTGITRSISSISTNTNAGSVASTDYIYYVSGTTTLTLPTAAGNTNRYTIKSITGTTTVATTSSQTIDGTTTIGIANQDSVDLTSDNTNWNVV